MSTRHTGLAVAVGVISLTIVATILVRGYFMRAQTPTDTETITTDVASVFTFEGAAGWRAGPHNHTSLAIFGPQRQDGTSSCFASMERKDGNVDVSRETNTLSSEMRDSGYTIRQTATVTQSLGTSDGDQSYRLQYYEVTPGSDSQRAMRGVARGYAQLDGYYAEVKVNCETAAELATTRDALDAYQLKIE